MPSPFPGMDPYLENPALWFGFHNLLAAEITAYLNRRIQPRYFAALEPFIVYEMITVGRPKGRRPDVSVIQPYPARGAVAVLEPTITAAPVESEVEVEAPVQLYRVEIRASETEELVTAIEILSPANKRPGSRGLNEYLAKRQEILVSDAHLLELDLLRGGERPPLAKPVPAAPYYMVLSRVDERPRVGVWPVQLAERLPVLPVPLTEPDPDIPLDVNTVLAEVYERGAYAQRLDYRQPPPPPPLAEDEARWLDQLLTEYRQQASS